MKAEIDPLYPIVIGGYLYVINTTAHMILLLEGKEDAGFIDYIFFYAFIFTIWPATAWVQPRVSKIFKRPKRILIPNAD